MRSVLVVITGGTICMQDSPNGLIPTGNFAQNLMVPTSDFHDGRQLERRPVIDEHGKTVDTITLHPRPRTPQSTEYTTSILEFGELIDSSSMDGSHWNKIATTLRANWERFDAFVVLHGTDTLAYTASMLSFVLPPAGKTVVVTGSQVSMYAPHNDAHDNLVDSLTFAAEYDIAEVAVMFHYHLYRGTRVTKVSAFSLAAFTTPNAKPLATVRKGRQVAWAPTLHSKLIRRPGTKRPLPFAAAAHRPMQALSTHNVAVLKVYPGISLSIIENIIGIGEVKGLVLETFGAGNVPIANTSPNLLDVLSKAVKKGIVVVSVTQCLTGSVTTAYESARRMERQGIVTGLDMTTEAAYTKLVYLLAQPDLSPDQVADQMRLDLRGELTADFREEQRNLDAVMTWTQEEKEAAAAKYSRSL